MLKNKNHFGVVAVLVGGLALTAASLRAETTVDSATGNPYSAIVSRNVFGLNPPAPPADPVQTDLPKITANGIMTLFGHLEVLFTTSASKGGKQTYYDLAEGQHQDDIGVLRIDEENGKATFDNHGVQQEITLPNESTPDGKISFARQFGTPPIARHPKPGDVDYVDQQSVMTPLPPTEPQDAQNQTQDELSSMFNSQGIGGNSSPPGHGGP